MSGDHLSYWPVRIACHLLRLFGIRVHWICGKHRFEMWVECECDLDDVPTDAVFICFRKLL